MSFLVDQFRFLGLNDKEVRVFTVLATFGRMNMTKISSRAGLSRTTVDAIVRRLVEQKLVEKERVGGHQEYSVKLVDVADNLVRLEKRLRTTSTTNSVPLEEGTKTQLTQTTFDSATPAFSCDPATVFCGHDSMHPMIQEAFHAHAGERVTMLVAALSTSKERMTRFEHCVSHARDAQIKLELLTTTDVSKGLSEYARQVLTFLADYDLRLNFLPPSFCFEQVDLVAFRDLVIVVDHKADVSEKVESARVVALINHLLRVAREAGWGMDIRMWLEGVIASQRATE
ncbi:MAG: MarR family transcriptional regulator [Candidatus Pacebacteria bacterium]|nr:MarR family transcriptional regulator [Candidatus Paceibacterota bacterium]